MPRLRFGTSASSPGPHIALQYGCGSTVWYKTKVSCTVAAERASKHRWCGKQAWLSLCKHAQGTAAAGGTHAMRAACGIACAVRMCVELSILGGVGMATVRTLVEDGLALVSGSQPAQRHRTSGTGADRWRAARTEKQRMNKQVVRDGRTLGTTLGA